MNTKKIKGFTLIELMVVVAIIAILAAIAIPAIFRYRIDANRAKCVGNMKQIQNAVEGYRSGHGGKNAATVWASYVDSSAERTGYFSATPVCPNDGEYNLQSANQASWEPACTKTEEPYRHLFENK